MAQAAERNAEAERFLPSVEMTWPERRAVVASQGVSFRTTVRNLAFRAPRSVQRIAATEPKKNPKPLGSGLKISSLRWIKEGSNIASGGR